MRASGGSARGGDKGERKRKEERGAPHNTDRSTAFAMGKAPSSAKNHEPRSRAES
jgi:hypothetical protein